MKRNVLWLGLSVVVSIAVVVGGCAPGPATTPPSTTSTATPTTVSPTAATPKGAEKPRYGGTLTYALGADPIIFDSGVRSGGSHLMGTVYEHYLTLDWARGPAGSGVTDFTSGVNSVEDHFGLQLAEGWEMPEMGVWKLQIRRGVRWQLTNTDAGRLMAGRQMTADDVVSSWNRLRTDPRSWGNTSQPGIMRASSIEKTGPWEVTIRTPVDEPWTSFNWVVHGAGYLRQYPPEVVARYGDVQDWRNSVGTGPFILLDYVAGSSLTFQRNPNYWDSDPVGAGKGNKLPYAETLKQLIIPDLSTRLAAFRTGKLDFLPDVVLDDAETLLKAAPQLEYRIYMSNNPWIIGMRKDRADKPFSDLRVRQALMLATDFEAFKKGLFRGQAEIDVYPVNKQLTSLYQPLSEMPQSVQDLFKYNPEKARQLLKEAGYPNGFKARIVTPSAAERVDELSIFKSQWAKVGIELELDMKESGAYTTIANARSHDDMIYRSPFQVFSSMLLLSGMRGTSIFNASYVNDPPGSEPYVEERYKAMQKNIFVDNPATYRAFKELKPYLLEQAYYIPRPTPYTYVFWWPWLKNCYGQVMAATLGVGGHAKYFWIDQELKRQILGR